MDDLLLEPGGEVEEEGKGVDESDGETPSDRQEAAETRHGWEDSDREPSEKIGNRCGESLGELDGETWALNEGQVIGAYRVLKPLGRGGMGEVYLVENIVMEKKYALKILSEDLANEDEFRRRFRREAKLMADLKDPGIVEVHNMGEKDGIYFLVMDYVKGPRGEPHTLGAEMGERGKIPEGEVRDISMAICTALQVAHDMGVIHRDIKPENVLLDGEKRPRLSDFGLARIAGNKFMQNMTQRSQALANSLLAAESPKLPVSKVKRAILGTYEYMSPEQKEAKAVDERSDVFSLGKILYRMLMGVRPEGRFPMPSSAGLSEGWDRVVQRALDPDPEKRFQSASELAGAIHRASGETVPGVDLNAKDEEGLTPLHKAARDGHTDYSSYLLSKGADVDARDANGRTPLAITAREGHMKLAVFLIAKGAGVNAKDNDRLTPLHNAADKDMAELLIQKGADVNAMDKSMGTPLHEAAKEGRLGVAELLIANSAVINASDRTGLTPLHWTVRKGHAAIVNLLVKKGADVNARTNRIETPLHEAAMQGDLGLAKLLIAGGANVGTGDKEGETPLHEVAKQGGASLAELLVAAGADIRATDREGETPLHKAAQRNHVALVKLLIEKGAPIDPKDRDGDTPLHKAAREGCSDAAELLMVAGADLDARNTKGMRPQDCAQRAGWQLNAGVWRYKVLQGLSRVARYLSRKTRRIFE